MEIPRLRVKSELQLPAYPTATATQDLSCVCDLYHSSQQCPILNPLSEARDQTCILRHTSQVHFHWATTGTLRQSWERRTELEKSCSLTSDYTTEPVVKTAHATGVKQTHRWTGQGRTDRTGSPELNPHSYGLLIYNKEGKDIQWGKDCFFNKWYWENWTAICKRSKTGLLSYMMHKNKFKMY